MGPLCSRGYPTWGCTISFWVPLGSLKKNWANFAIFKFSFFAVTWPKMVENAQNQNHPTRLSKIYLDSKFQLIWPSNGRENPKKTTFFGEIAHSVCALGNGSKFVQKPLI